MNIKNAISRFATLSRVVTVGLAMIAASAAIAADDVLDRVLNELRAPAGSPVEPGVWNGDLDACQDYANKYGVPMIAVWSYEGCAHCKILERAILSDAFREWQKNCGYVLCFTCSRDRYATRQGNEGTRENKGTGYYYWFCKRPNMLKDYPFVRFYWYVDGQKKVDYSVVGDTLDKQQGIAPDVDANGNYIRDEKGNLVKNFNKAGRYVIDYIQNTSGFGAYIPKPSYVGGYFDLPEEEGSDECAQLQAEPTTGTLYIPLTRGETEAYTQEMKLETVPKTRKAPQTVSFEWDEGETNKTVEIANFGASWYEAGKNVLVTLLDDEGNSAAEATVRFVDAPENSVDNPLWVGEEFDFGDWTMDLDAAKAKVAAAEGAAYTLVAVEGNLWCHDCANTTRNFLNVKNGNENKFQAWAKSKNIALVTVDIPNYTGPGEEDFASPTLLSRKSYSSTLAYEIPAYNLVDVSQGGADQSLTEAKLRSGVGYLSRKGVSDEAAAAQLSKFHTFVATNTDAGGVHRPEDVEIGKVYRTGVPIYVLLDKSGKVVGRFTRFAMKSTLTADAANFDKIIARFDEMIELADGEHADDIENNFPSDSSVALAANGGSASGELSCADKSDTFRLDGVDGGVLQSVAISGTADANVKAYFATLDEEGKSVMVGEPVTGSLKDGLVLEYEFTSRGTYYVRVEVADDGAGYFAYDSANPTFAAFDVSASVVLVPQEGLNTAELADGQTNVVLKLENGQLYRMQGIEPAAGVLVADETLGGKPYYRAATTGNATVAVEAGAIAVSYQKWLPGTVGFEVASATANEDAGEIKVNVVRTGGASGKATVSVTLDEANTDFSDSEGNPRYEAFEPVEFTWADGNADTNTVTISLKYIARYDGDGQIALALARTDGASDLGTTNFVLSVKEVDKANPGTIEFTGADPFFSKPSTVFVKAGEEATLLATRTADACDSDVSVAVTTTKGTLAAAEAAWANHVAGDVEIKLGGLKNGESATVTLSNPAGGAKLGKTKALKVQAVAADAPEFMSAANDELALWRYVATSNLFQLAAAPKGRVTFVKTMGALPSGLKATYDAAANALAIWGVPSKAGEFEVVYQVKDGAVAGLTTKINFSISDPTDAKNNPDGANAAVSKARTFNDLMATGPKTRLMAPPALLGTMKLTVPTKGNLSGKLVCSDGSIALSAKGWSDFDSATKTLTAELTGKGGYAATAVVENSGAVKVTITKDGGEFATVETDGTVWGAKNPASDWKGYYTVLLPVEGTISEGLEGISPQGAGYLTLKMDNAAAWNAGKVTWAGMLPNGTAVSGSTVLTRDGDFALMPAYKSSTTDLLAGALKIEAKALANENRLCVTGADMEFTWAHTEKKTEDACWELNLGAYGAYYDSKNDDLACYCEESYSGARELVFYVDGNALHGVTVKETSMALTAGQENPQALRLTFTRNTGVVKGSFKLEDGTKADYQGVILIGWSKKLDCGCSEIDDSLMQPFVGGSYFHGVSVPYMNGTRKMSLTVKTGGLVSIDL